MDRREADVDTYVPGNVDLEDRPLKELVRDLSQDSMMLVRQETALFKKEMEGRIHKLERQAAVLGTGGVIAYTGALVLSAALVLLLRHAMPDWVAALIVGTVYAVVGLVMVMRGKNEISRETIAPETTKESVKRDVRALREAMHRGT
jgi:hypothetical protein